MVTPSELGKLFSSLGNKARWKRIPKKDRAAQLAKATQAASAARTAAKAARLAKAGK